MQELEQLLQQELDEAIATIAKVEAENESLRRRLPVAMPPHAPGRTPPSAARSDTGDPTEDRFVRLEREIEAANATIANLNIENAILQSQLSRLQAKPLSPVVRRVIVASAIAVAGAAIWFVTENAGLLLLFAIVLGLGWGLVRLIEAIPSRRPRHQPGIKGG